ncbi:GatB/Yqey domain protein [Alkaliphilus metalliredigens QYMF]|uniref:GatB/Yqey domain protein n=1 Tax=Alkaliphilus metalliredigens (strain QYMF) TaxID=293826 RepID=A6TSL3_ALKMQ|nr:GatB/YqeY domain-containing protein [Alkaliphilus metalliredigens]ABR49181.1 GatB/Yqey domain protein [Alkaliphilus metalliredigens QYMF]
MSLKAQLANDLKEAMKNKDTLRKSVITMIRSDIKQVEVDQRIELNDEDIIEILSKQAKQRRDAAVEFRKGNRQDLVEEVQQELEVIMSYLPEQLTPEEVAQVVDETISEVGAASIKEMGKIMAAVMPKLKGKADGKIVNQIVRERLQS